MSPKQRRSLIQKSPIFPSIRELQKSALDLERGVVRVTNTRTRVISTTPKRSLPAMIPNITPNHGVILPSPSQNPTSTLEGFALTVWDATLGSSNKKQLFYNAQTEEITLLDNNEEDNSVPYNNNSTVDSSGRAWEASDAGSGHLQIVRNDEIVYLSSNTFSWSTALYITAHPTNENIIALVATNDDTDFVNCIGTIDGGETWIVTELPGQAGSFGNDGLTDLAITEDGVVLIVYSPLFETESLGPGRLTFVAYAPDPVSSFTAVELYPEYEIDDFTFAMHVTSNGEKSFAFLDRDYYVLGEDGLGLFSQSSASGDSWSDIVPPFSDNFNYCHGLYYNKYTDELFAVLSPQSIKDSLGWSTAAIVYKYTDGWTDVTESFSTLVSDFAVFAAGFDFEEKSIIPVRQPFI